MRPCQTLDEVIDRLQQIVAKAREEGDPLGIFASVYLGVTRDVKEGVLNGRFQDGPRMEHLDVTFANRYLEAFDQFRKGVPCSESWLDAFQGATHTGLIILQHLFLGMNAHINLDLGIASAEVAPGDQLSSLEGDFMEINKLLGSRIDLVQAKLSELSPLFFLLDWAGGIRDEKFAEFSLNKARNHAWSTAQKLAYLSGEEKAIAIAELDGYVSTLNSLITNPGRLLGMVLKLIKRFENKDVKTIMQVMG
ncbi:MAG: hypothetical protein IPL49_14680 [Saprospirales bacterium]|nr:hypothetical protein [Saprospirales bacterium]MBK8492087.1 hypothetical protein [Saprospirales bacterium]